MTRPRLLDLCGQGGRRVSKYAYLAAFIAVVVIANAATNAAGMVTVIGATATAGTWIAGFGFVARDGLQEAASRRWVWAAILAGAGLSALFSPTLALASGVAFIVSEGADWSVYTPLRRRSPLGAALTSNTVGAVIDSILFLTLAGFPVDMWSTQVLVKVGTTTAFVLGVRLALPRQPMRAGGGRHA